MNKSKIIFIGLLISFSVLIVFTVIKIKHKQELRQKAVLALEMRKVLGFLMLDLREARVGTILDAPPDGLWHSRIAFNRAPQGVLEYSIKDGHLYRISKVKRFLVADHIAHLLIRRQKLTPYIVEVQIEAQNKVSLMSYLKIRIHN